MNVKLNRKDFPEPEQRSHLIHRAGALGTGLFPGWGPKL